MASHSYEGMGNLFNVPATTAYNDNPSNDLSSTPARNRTHSAIINKRTQASGRARNFGSDSPGLSHCALVLIILFICAQLTGCGVTVSPTSNGSVPTIASFTADPTSISSGASSTLSWIVTGATSIAITPGTFTSTSARGSTSVSPTATTTYTLTATNATGSTTSTLTVTVTAASKPTISSFTASPTSITSGSSSTLSWATTGATSIAITPGTFTSTSASGSTSVSPTATTTYTLTATNTAGSTDGHGKSHGNRVRRPLGDHDHFLPGRNARRGVCRLHHRRHRRHSALHIFREHENSSVPPLPEGMSLDATTGAISSSLIGGQGTYTPEFVVTDSTSAQATQNISFAINGNNAFLANIFPSTSIFHHRVDAATTSLPVDTSPAAPMYSGYLPETVKPFFGNNSDAPFPNGIPAIEVPYNQADVSVSTTLYQSYFTSGPIPAVCSGGRHQQLDGRPARSGLPGGRRRKQSRALRNVAGNLRGRSLDRFLERALAQRVFECPDPAREWEHPMPRDFR